MSKNLKTLFPVFFIFVASLTNISKCNASSSHYETRVPASFSDGPGNVGKIDWSYDLPSATGTIETSITFGGPDYCNYLQGYEIPVTLKLKTRDCSVEFGRVEPFSERDRHYGEFSYHSSSKSLAEIIAWLNGLSSRRDVRPHPRLGNFYIILKRLFEQDTKIKADLRTLGFGL